jgi:hypothetical protein
MLAPGWNSIDSVTKIQNILWWTGWIFFALVLIFEVASHLYGNRRDKLLDDAAAQRQSDDKAKEGQHQSEVDSLKARSDKAERAFKKIEESTRRRIITPEQRRDMVADLSRFSKQKFQIFSENGDSESEILKIKMYRVLKNSGWDMDDTVTSVPLPAMPSNMGGFTLSGPSTVNATIFINEFDATSRGECWRAALALGGELEPASAQIGNNVPPGTIVLLINRIPPDIRDMQQLNKWMDDQSEATDEVLKVMPLSQLIQELARCPKISFSLYSPFDDADANTVSEMISGIMRTLHWHQTNGNLAHADYQIDFKNLMVGINPEDKASGNIPESAVVLLDSLKQIGVVDKTDALRVVNDVPKGEITIRVGISPFKRLTTLPQ